MRKLFCTTALVSLAGWAGAAAQTAPAGSAAIEEVVVTAQRREQMLIDVPISISSVSAETLEEVGAKTGASIQGLVPALNINATASYGGSPVSIRGTSGLGGGEDPVAVYVDDIYTSSGQFSVTALSDVASVEVVRGPQGTLQGRNATAGALIIRTADPQPEFGGFIRGSVEDPNAHRIEAAATGPLTETLLARMSFDWLNEEGWATNLFDGRNMGGIRMHNVRTVLLWEPNDAARVRLAVNYQDRIVSQPTVRWAQTNISPPPGPVTPVGTQTPHIPLPRDVADRFLEGNLVNLNIEPRNHLRTPSVALNMQYDFGPVALVSVTGASNFTNEGVNDSDSLPMTDRQGRNYAKYTGSSVSQELRLQSNGENLVDWIVGLYYARYQNTMNFHIVNERLSVAFNQLSHFESHQTNPNWAVFADATWHVTDQLSVTGGVRYTEDTKDFRNVWRSLNTDTGVQINRLAFAAPERTWTDTSYRAKVAWEPSDDLMAYLSYSKGFKGGGYNSFGVGPQPGYSPEIMISWEVGVKAYLWDRRAFVAAAAYDNEYDNLQVTSGVPTGGVVITNAAAAKIQGFEVEGELRPTENWVFTGNVAYIDGVFSSFPRAPDILGVQRDVSGNRLTNSPEWQYFLQGQYRTELTDAWRLRATVNWRWRDEIFFHPTDQNLPHLRGEANGELGARVSFIYEPRDLTLAIYGANLNNSRVVANQGLTFSYAQAFFNRPRVIGVQLEKRF
ncbi:TonB-dependent receptor [Phenylobacterium sp.]|jgi:iron complex outermembrane receptor protein|uniref:TonB-dependent receptor n=1 Tax=Phenylobacterium sp. TaxID=1871053 RepID=UPI002F92F5C3